MKTIEDYLKTSTFTNVVVGYALKDDQVLLGQRKKVSQELGKNLIAGIGGKVEPGRNSLYCQ